ncbi:hypothetical protein BJV78DRAFT_205769 [Lactifluus subvellereus]|nr:hypothetical protein BJV78DRAFT_205769 [Lactifluus subvellereus]
MTARIPRRMNLVLQIQIPQLKFLRTIRKSRAFPFPRTRYSDARICKIPAAGSAATTDFIGLNTFRAACILRMEGCLPQHRNEISLCLHGYDNGGLTSFYPPLIPIYSPSGSASGSQSTVHFRISTEAYQGKERTRIGSSTLPMPMRMDFRARFSSNLPDDNSRLCTSSAQNGVMHHSCWAMMSFMVAGELW